MYEKGKLFRRERAIKEEKRRTERKKNHNGDSTIKESTKEHLKMFLLWVPMFCTFSFSACLLARSSI
jgi:hypothetical protein